MTECGTYAGHQHHRYLAEPPCKACQEAAKKYRRDLYAKTHPSVYRRRNSGKVEPVKKRDTGRVLGPIPHGTEPGYSAHRRRKEEPCAACKKAKSEYTLARKKAKLQNPIQTHEPKETTVPIPLKLFADLYWTASPAALVALDELFGQTKVDQFIKKSEEE